MGDLNWQVQNDENTEFLTPEMKARVAFDPWFPSFQVIRDIGIMVQRSGRLSPLPGGRPGQRRFGA